MAFDVLLKYAGLTNYNLFSCVLCYIKNTYGEKCRLLLSTDLIIVCFLEMNFVGLLMLSLKFNYLLVTIFFFVTFSAVKSDIVIIEDIKNVNIQISGLKPEISVIDTNQLLSVSDIQNHLSSYNKSANAISFQIAVPDDGSKISYSVLSEKPYDIDDPGQWNLPSEFHFNKSELTLSRGINVIDITLLPFRFDFKENKVYFADSIEILITHSLSINLSHKINLGKEEPFFVNIDNIKQLQTLINQRDLSKSDKMSPSLLASNWYNPDVDFVRIETIKDAVTKVRIADISTHLPGIIGKNSRHIHLLHRGEPYPYIILNDDGIISENDEVIFYGRRPAGDTTWFDSYTNHEAFFIYLDENSNGLRFTEMSIPNENELPISNSVEIDRHYEVERAYSRGNIYLKNSWDGTAEKSFFYDTRTIMGEGWFWEIIAPPSNDHGINKTKFSHNILLAPSNLPEDNLTFSLWYRTTHDSIHRSFKPVVSTYYDNRLNINGNQKSRDSITGYHFRSINYQSASNNFLNGLNNIELETKQIYIETNDLTNIDFIKVKGFVQPVANEDNIDFNGKSGNMKLNTFGFKSNQLVALDVVNSKYKQVASNSQGTVFRIGGSVDWQVSATLGISDSVVYSNQPGIHILSYSHSNKNYTYRHFPGSDNSHNGYLNSIPNGDAIAVLILSASNISTDFSAIRSLGSSAVNDFRAGKVYSGSFIKSSQVLLEQTEDLTGGFTEFLVYPTGINYNFEVAFQSDESSSFLLNGVSGIRSADNIMPVNKSNLRNNNKLDAVFISHRNFIPQAERLAEYRRKTLGMKIEVVDADDIYKEFSYGRKTPHGIKEFLKYTYDNRKLTYVLLLGDASRDARKVMDNSLSTNWIPTYGFPVSDWWYACLDGENDVRPELILGRVPVNSLQQMSNYTDKVIEYENTPEAPWMKNILFLIGGYDPSEVIKFKNLISGYYRNNILNPPLCGTISEVIKDSDGPSTASQGGAIRGQINKGTLWTIYIGHAAAEMFDLDGWSVNSLNNKGRYGLLTTVSCNTGAFAEPQLIASRNEEYILEKDKGFVAATGGSFTGFLQAHNQIASRMISALADTNKKMRFIGDLMIYGKANTSSSSFDQLSTLHTFTLLGDPLVRARVGTEPDAFLTESDLTIKNQNGTTRFTDKDDYISIDGKIYNYGYQINEEFQLRIIRDYNLQSDTLYTNYSQLCYFDDYNFSFDIKDMPGRHRITIEADPLAIIRELTKENNKLVVHIDVFKEGLLNLDPLPYWDISTINPQFRVINPFSDESDFSYNFLLTSRNDTSDVLYYGESGLSSTDVFINENYIDWKPEISLSEGSYWFHSRYINKSNQTWSTWTSIPIHADNKFDSKSVSAVIKSRDEFHSGQIKDLMFRTDDGNSKLLMRRDTVKFKSLGIKGNHIDNPEGNPVVVAYVNIEAGGVVFVDGGHDLGFNVATVKSTNGELITRSKRFETWGLDIPYPAEKNFDTATVSHKLVEFLRDSVADDEYIMIATCKSSFRIPYLFKMYGEEGNHGSVDSLLYYLRSFGSKIADTLVFDENFNGEQVSFAMMGWRGAEIGSIPEAISFVGDTAMVSGDLVTFSGFGSVNSPLISKSKEWKSIEVSGNYPDNGTQVELVVKGLNSETSSIDTIMRVLNPELIVISSFDTRKYQTISTDLNFNQSRYDINSLLINPETYISSIKYNFIAADEFAVVRKESEFDKSTLLRGQDINLTTSVENLSLRNDVDSVNLRINVSRGGTDNDYRNIILNDFTAASAKTINHEIKTDYLDYYNTVSINIDPKDDLIEFFRFNNNFTLPLKISPDTIKPSIVLKIDGVVHNYNDYISMMPMFEIEFYDNSPLQITDSNSITVRVNGFLHPYQRTIWSEFVTVNDGTNLKAVFRFIPDTLQFEDASIIVYVYDNEGNRDTLTTMARLSLVNAFVEDVFTYPNPAKDDIVKFNLNYKAPEHGATAKIEIYDLSGNRIDELEQVLRLGQNTVEWNARNNRGYSLPSGVYFYRIHFTSRYYMEPVYGKFIIIR